MGVSSIDGTLEEAHLKRARRNLRIYDQLKFRLADGGTKTVAKAVVDEAVAELLLPGTSGRFYLYTAIDHRGVHGVRAENGRSAFKYPRNNEIAMLAVAGIGLALILFNLAMDRLSIWGLLCLVLGALGYFLYRATRSAAEGQYAGDASNQALPAAE